MKRILFFGYHNLHGARAVTLKEHYEQEGYEVVQCHTDAKGVIGKYRDLWKKCTHKSQDGDEILVMFAGHYLMPLAWLLTRRPRKKLHFDAFISIYDTLVRDRKLVSRWSPVAWFYYIADIVSTHLADNVILDTESHADFFSRSFFLPRKKVTHIYLDAVKELFFPSPSPSKKRRVSNVLFFGTFIPLQGVETIIKAASLLEREDTSIQFTLIGSGQTLEESKRLAERLETENLVFVDRVPFEELPDYIRDADICLGIFGESDKASRVIPHKVYESVACGIPIITRDSPGIRERFARHKLVILSEAGNPTDLARKIRERIAKK